MDYLSTRQLQLTLYNIEVRNITAMMEIKNLFQNNDYFIVMASFTKTAWLLTQVRNILLPVSRLQSSIDKRRSNEVYNFGIFQANNVYSL